MRTKAFRTISLCLVAAALVFGGCASENGDRKPSISGGNDIAIMPTSAPEQGSDTEQGTGETVSQTGIILDLDMEKQVCTIQMLDTSAKVVYNYNGGTGIANRYGDATTMEQIPIGEVVDIQYWDTNKKLISLQVSDREWEYTGATNLNIDTGNKLITIGGQQYTYTDKLVVVYDGKLIHTDKIEPVDVVTLKGRDKQIDSLIVTSGHGYVRLDSTSFFEGGYVEIGAKILKVITENMVIPVPAGNYVLTVTKDDIVGSKDIKIEENEEIRVNLTEFQETAVRYGSVQFKISPSGASLEIDGKKADYSALVDLPYGTHSVVISMDGYSTYKETINVQNILTEYDITLIENGETSGTDTKETTTSKEDGEKETTTTKSDTETTKKNMSGTLTEETTTYNYESAWYGILSDFLNE